VPATTSIPSTLTSPADRVVRIENSDHDSADSSLDYSLHARQLRFIASSARLKSGEQGGTCQCLFTKLLLQQGELGMLSRAELSAEGLAKNDAISRHDCSNLWRYFARLTLTLARKGYGSLHEWPVIRAVWGLHEPQACKTI
jgi:hypothetical protein